MTLPPPPIKTGIFHINLFIMHLLQLMVKMEYVFSIVPSFLTYFPLLHLLFLIQILLLYVVLYGIYGVLWKYMYPGST